VVPERFVDQLAAVLEAVPPLAGEEALYGEFRVLLDAAAKDPAIKQALIAFADRSDTCHPLFRRLSADPAHPLTSSLVIAEGHAWFLRRYDATRGLEFMAMIGEMPFLSIAAV
jgi:hypothetical protein